MTPGSGDAPAIELEAGAAAELLVSRRGATVIVVEGSERAAAVTAAMRARLAGVPKLDDLAAAWRAGIAEVGGGRVGAAIAYLHDDRATIVHAGDLAVHAIGNGAPRRLVVPHTGLHAHDSAPLRVRTRAMGLAGPAGEPEVVECALGGATHLAVLTVSVWAPLRERIAELLGCAASSHHELARDILAEARAHHAAAEKALRESTPRDTIAPDELVRRTADRHAIGLAMALANVPRGCVIVRVPEAAVADVPPAPVPVAGQRTARRAIRAVLAGAIGRRAALLVGARGGGKSAVLEQLARAGAVAGGASVVTSAQLRKAARTGAPICASGSVALVDGLADALAGDGSTAAYLADAIASRTPVVATATADEHASLAGTHRGLLDRFAVVELAAPSRDELVAIAMAWVPRLVARHGVRVEAAAVAVAVELSQRFPLGRGQPEAALFVLEQAALRAGNSGVVSGTVTGRGGGTVDRAAVVAAIGDQTGLPVELVDSDDERRAAQLAERLAGALHGQGEALDAIAGAIARGVARRSREAATRPLATLLLLGPTGTGKTETARLLAESWFLDRRALTTIDLAEYADAASVHRLVGAPPGYVGHGARPPLAGALAGRGQQIILFDELEKAHRAVHDIMLEVLDEGRLTTAHGEVISFRDAIVVVTSNLGGGGHVGFGAASARSESGDRAALAHDLRPELVARFDAVVRYAELDGPAATAIALGRLARAADALMACDRLAPSRLPELRRRLLAQLAGRTRFAGGAREVQRLVDQLLVEERGAPARDRAIVVVYPFLDTGRERWAAGFAVELQPGTEAAAADAVLVHPAGTSLLHVSHGGGRLIALAGDLTTARELAAAVAPFAAGPARCAEGRVRADFAGRPVGELIDALLVG